MKRILWTLAILIIPPFVFWGAGSALRSRQKGATYAGIIFGKKISFDEYQDAWQATRTQALMMYGSKLDEIYEALNLEQQAWERLILLKEAKRKKIRVSDDEVINMIQKFPFFQSKGRFDERAYDLILKQVLRIDARQFEEEMRDSLAIAKLQDSIMKGIKITDEEVKDAYKQENEKSRVAYILISPTAVKQDININEALSKRYYQDNTESFRVGDQVNIEYMGFEFSDYQKAIQVTDEEVKTYYDKHNDEFDPKKEFKELKDMLKNSLIQEKARQNALLAAEKIDYILADKTKSFEGTAKENSISIKETGFFGKEGPIPQIGWFPEIQKIAFKLNTGERSDLIKSKTGFTKGFYIIKLKERKPPYIPMYEEVKGKIENILKEDEAVRRASKQVERLHRKIVELIKRPLPSGRQIKFEEAASKIKHRVNYSEPFTRNDYIKGLGLANELGEAAFNIGHGGISPVVKTRSGFCIFTVLEIIPMDEERFKKEKTEFTKKSLEGKKSKVLNEWYYKLLKQANLSIPKDALTPS